MAEQSYNLKYTGKEIDDLLDKANAWTAPLKFLLVVHLVKF